MGSLRVLKSMGTSSVALGVIWANAQADKNHISPFSDPLGVFDVLLNMWR